MFTPRLTPKTTELKTPSPYIEINFKCTHRDFREVKSDIYTIALTAVDVPQDVYLSERCDHDGDLESIRLYTEDQSQGMREALIAAYGLTDIPDDADLVFTCL
jgi:hypothetical protein